MNIEKLQNWYLYFTLFVSGAVVLVIEIVGTRILAPQYGSTVFVWSSLIAVTLGFLSLGYVAGGFLADKRPFGAWFYSIIFWGGAAALLLLKTSRPILEFSSAFGFRFGALVAALLLFALPLFLLSMAGPFAIRLLSRSLLHTGHTSGVVFGVSTAGSLVGALLSGFYLIPNFYVETILIAAPLAVMAVAAGGFLLTRSHRKHTALSVLLAAILFTVLSFNSAVPEAARVVERMPSFYGEIQVVERGGFRCVGVKSQSQTCMKIVDGSQALFYGTLIDDLFSSQPKKRALVIGFGGGVLTRDLKDNFKIIDVIDIDPRMFTIAEEHFGYDPSDPSINGFVGDGRTFLKESASVYDAVIFDVFSGASPVPHLFTKEAFEAARRVLLPDGVIVINSIGRSYGRGDLLPRSIGRTVQAVFPYVGVLSTENIKDDPSAFGNIIFVASSAEISFPAIDGLYIVPYGAAEIKDAVLLSDNHNPIETLSAATSEESQAFYQEIFGTL